MEASANVGARAMTDHLARINEAASRIAALETLMTFPAGGRAEFVLGAWDYLPRHGGGPIKTAWFPEKHMAWLVSETRSRVDGLIGDILEGEREALRRAALDLYNSVAEADPCAAARESVEGACPAEDIDAAPAEAGDVATLAGRMADRVEAQRKQARDAERREAEHTRDMCS